MSRTLLGVTGSVAALKTPLVHDTLRQAGHEVKVVATVAATYFFDPAGIAALPVSAGAVPVRNPAVMILDEDEWPGRAEGRRWQPSEAVLHIELRRWADLLVIA